MKNKVKQEIISLCKELDLKCNITPKDSLYSAKRKFQDKTIWSKVYWGAIVPYGFNKVPWDFISSYIKLSEEFIREFQDNVNWYSISSHQKLSEDFIREFKDKVCWYNISQHQSLSEDFIREFKDNVDLFSISCNLKLVKNLKDLFSKRAI